MSSKLFLKIVKYSESQHHKVKKLVRCINTFVHFVLQIIIIHVQVILMFIIQFILYYGNI